MDGKQRSTFTQSSTTRILCFTLICFVYTCTIINTIWPHYSSMYYNVKLTLIRNTGTESLTCRLKWVFFKIFQQMLQLLQFRLYSALQCIWCLTTMRDIDSDSTSGRISVTCSIQSRYFPHLCTPTCPFQVLRETPRGISKPIARSKFHLILLSASQADFHQWLTGFKRWHKEGRLQSAVTCYVTDHGAWPFPPL